MYTVLVGDYENLPELPTVARGKIDAFCFTDNPELTSESWNIVLIEPLFRGDNVRSQRFVKIAGHPTLDAYDETLFIDVSVQLRANPADLLKKWLKRADIAIPGHSFRATVSDEFDQVVKQKLDSRERVTEQERHYREHFLPTLESQPLWTAIIARRNTPEVRRFNDVWAQHVLRYSRRDQLSVLVAAHVVQLDIRRIPLDNHASKFHRWPVRSGFNADVRTADILESYSESAESRAEIDRLRAVIEDMWASPSWRLTKPLRMFRKRK
jgi:hypothetical protein